MTDEVCCTDGERSTCTVEAIVSVGERGQMLLPKELRERAGIHAGEKLALVSYERDGAICCISLIKAEVLSGMVKGILNPIFTEVH